MQLSLSNYHVNKITNDKIYFSRFVGWDFCFTEDSILVFVDSGYKNDTCISYHRIDDNQKHIILPFLFECNLFDGNITYTKLKAEFQKIDNLNKIDNLINKSECIKKINNMYFDIYMKPLTEIKILEILQIEGLLEVDENEQNKKFR